MNTRDYFKDIYTDFFGIESLPKIEVKEEKDEVGPQAKMASLFSNINDLSVSEESKELLKKIIEYMRKYQEGIENNYIQFRLNIVTSSNDLSNEIINIIFEAARYFKYVSSTQKQEISMYKIDKITGYNNLGMIVFNNLKGLNLEEDKKIKLFIYDLTEFLKQDEKCLITITGTKEELNNFYLGREELKNKYFDLTLEGINPDIQDIYNDILTKVNVEETLKVSLLDYISNTYKDDIDFNEYKQKLIKYLSFNKSLPPLATEKTIDEVFASLNELVGLSKVKKVLHELVDLMNLKSKAGNNLSIKDVNLHMVFLGNPGTGKTTIARLLADILYDLKYIKENKLVEVSAKDLVAEYVGQTAPKTMAVIEKSMNGILFIDEAYILASRNDNSYNDEAIATLIQAMENYRDKLVVIFAGYTKEMQAFLNSNSGIASRIGYTLEFDDYTTDELVEIFLGMTQKAGFVVEEEALTYLREVIEENRHVKNFGNARFVRNIYEKTIIRHASNVKDKKQKKVLKTITKKDINIENLILD